MHSHHPKYVQGEAIDSSEIHSMPTAKMKGSAIDSGLDETEMDKTTKSSPFLLETGDIIGLHFDSEKNEVANKGCYMDRLPDRINHVHNSTANGTDQDTESA